MNAPSFFFMDREGGRERGGDLRMSGAVALIFEDGGRSDDGAKSKRGPRGQTKGPLMRPSI